MSKLGANSFIIFLLCGFCVLLWSAYDLAMKKYKFWSQGLEQKITVIEKDHTSGTVKGGNTYYYKVQISGIIAVIGFPEILQEGEKYNVLVLGDNEEVILGKRSNNIFDIFSAQMGSKLYAVLAIILYFFVIFFTPKAILEIIKNRKKLYQ